jgi:hypothetical protein
VISAPSAHSRSDFFLIVVFSASVVSFFFCPYVARKTKCDGQHPTCQSCERRKLDCSYVNESSGRGKRGHAAAAAQAAQAAAVQAQKQKGPEDGLEHENGTSVDEEANGGNGRGESGSASGTASGAATPVSSVHGKRAIEVDGDDVGVIASKRMRMGPGALEDGERKPRLVDARASG